MSAYGQEASCSTDLSCEWTRASYAVPSGPGSSTSVSERPNLFLTPFARQSAAPTQVPGTGQVEGAIAAALPDSVLGPDSVR